MNLEFANLGIGKYAFLALIPLIILYIIRPKPKDKVIPSIMFLIKLTGKGKAAAFLRKIISDPIFLLQFLIIILIATAAVEPMIEKTQDLGSKNTILVLDVSASMQTNHRFRDMVRNAKDNLRGSISIILIKNQPEILLERGTKGEASAKLNELSVTATSSNIADAILLAEGILGDDKGKIVVISDFIDTTGANLEDLKNIISKKGMFIEFIDVEKEASNIGIVNLKYGKELSTLYLKNFNDKKVNVKVKLGKQVEEIEIMPNSIETVPLIIGGGLNEINLDFNDDFTFDNTVYLNVPENEKIKVLLITNMDRSFLQDFLIAYDQVELEINNPPLIPVINQDIVIIHGVNQRDFLLSTVNKLKEYVNNHGNLIIAAQSNLPELGLNELLPINITGTSNETYPVIKVKGDLTRDLSFDKVYEHFTTKGNAVDILTTDQGDSLVSFIQHGNSKIVYYGIIEDQSDFKLSLSYPLFWQRMFNYLVGAVGFGDLNRKTDSILAFKEEKTIETPTKEVVGTKVLLEEVGFYRFDGRVIAVNLLNQNESQVNKDEKYRTRIHATEQTTDSTSNTMLNLLIYLLIAGIVLALVEIFILKFRGDL